MAFFEVSTARVLLEDKDLELLGNEGVVWIGHFQQNADHGAFGEVLFEPFDGNRVVLVGTRETSLNDLFVDWKQRTSWKGRDLESLTRNLDQHCDLLGNGGGNFEGDDVELLLSGLVGLGIRSHSDGGQFGDFVPDSNLRENEVFIDQVETFEGLQLEVGAAFYFGGIFDIIDADLIGHSRNEFLVHVDFQSVAIEGTLVVAGGLVRENVLKLLGKSDSNEAILVELRLDFEEEVVLS